MKSRERLAEALRLVLLNNFYKQGGLIEKVPTKFSGPKRDLMERGAKQIIYGKRDCLHKKYRIGNEKLQSFLRAHDVNSHMKQLKFIQHSSTHNALHMKTENISDL